MSLTVLMALCILGLDLLIYLLFRRVYGDKRIALARQLAMLREQSPFTFRRRPTNDQSLGRKSQPTLPLEPRQEIPGLPPP